MSSIDSTFNDFDFIGDIHGHSNDLKMLLEQLGYQNKDGFYQHPTRKAFFLGDYIDRGINVVEVLHIVKAMVDNHQAIALMGNHEYNAICYNTKDTHGHYLREHNKKNFNQHAVTMAAFMADPLSYKNYIDWFTTLPLFYENDHFRAVHACWDPQSIDCLKQYTTNGVLPLDKYPSTKQKDTTLYQSLETVLKGIELKLPKGQIFYDKDRVIRSAFRISWWKAPEVATYKELSAVKDYPLPDTALDINQIMFYSPQDKPVFFGHYWMRSENGETPKILQSNVACLDFSVASDGILVGYRYNGEQKLSSLKLYYTT